VTVSGSNLDDEEVEAKKGNRVYGRNGVEWGLEGLRLLTNAVDNHSKHPSESAKSSKDGRKASSPCPWVRSRGSRSNLIGRTETKGSHR
jgi:hypothetical protein